jgi:hypothetical protein
MGVSQMWSTATLAEPTTDHSIERKHITALVVLFCVTRALALLGGLRYLKEETATFWQFLDLELLRDHLFRTLLHSHSQPPGFNALVGVAEKVGGTHYDVILLGLNFLSGLCAVLAVYLVLSRLRVSPLLCFTVALLLLLNPAEITFEFDPLYTEFVVVLNCLIALATVWFLGRRSARALYTLVALCMCLILLRSLYQWIWVAAIMAVLWAQLPRNRAQIQTAAAIAIFFSLLWPAKNEIFFKHFISSTWTPYNVARHWETKVDQPPIQDWRRQGLLPSVAGLDESEAQFGARLQSDWPAPRTGFPELDDIFKQTGGAINWNSAAMLRFHDAQAKDNAFLLRNDPKAYVHGVLRGTWNYFLPSSAYLTWMGTHSTRQYQLIAPFDRLVRRLCCNVFGFPAESGSIGLDREDPRTSMISKIKALCMGSLLLYGVVAACLFSFARTNFWRGDEDRKVLAMILITTIAYSFMVSNLLEVAENFRYRFETQSLAMIVAAVFLQQVWDRRTATRGA